jgi:hypothetical protein
MRVQGLLKKQIAATLIPFLLLPNFLFLVPLAPIAAATEAPSTPGQPLPPGNIEALQTWNQTQQCPPGPSGEPLLPIPQWSLKLSIPEASFMGESSGTLATQTYTVSGDGRFSVSDSAGNRFTLGAPGGLPSGSLTMLLAGNSTHAEQTFEVRTGPTTDARLVVSYSIAKHGCQASGIEITLSGSAHWSTGTGTISLPFMSVPGSVSGDRAWFGNSSSVALGFDWSDSAAMNPTYSSTARSIFWPVGDSFTIDPVTITTSTSSSSTMYSYQTHVCAASRRTWVFYFTGSTYDYVSSITGLTGNWSSPTSIPTSGGLLAGGMGMACSGSTVYRGVVSGPSGYGWWFDSGTLNTDGTISWGNEVQVSPTGQYTLNNMVGGPSVSVDSKGGIWVGVVSHSRTGLQIWDCPATCGTVTSWTDAYSPSGQALCGQVLPLKSGKLATVYETGGKCNGGGGVDIQVFDGVST